MNTQKSKQTKNKDFKSSNSFLRLSLVKKEFHKTTNVIKKESA